MNNTDFHSGRFGNLLYINTFLHLYAKKNDLVCKYKYYDEFQELGIDLFSGNTIYTETIPLEESNYEDLFKSQIDPTTTTTPPQKKNLSIRNNVWLQNEHFSKFLRNYYNEPQQKSKIMTTNKYKDRYNNNQDLFIHVRLGDIKDTDCMTQYEYYDKAITLTQYEKAYISSDSIDHPICQRLIEKYNLIPFNDTVVNTIMFGSTCKNLVLSNGTFSWMLGIFGYHTTNIYYPTLIAKWHGNIFVFPDWTEITIE
jgi:hypothetical protein